MQFDIWLNTTILTLFTLAVIIIGLPAPIYLLKKGAEALQKYKFNKVPNNFLIASGLGNYSIEILFYGLIVFIFSVWYLFFYKGGQLNYNLMQLKKLIM